MRVAPKRSAYRSDAWSEPSMERLPGHYAFNIVFTLSFFAAFAAFMIQYG